jgi:hypothetical protein
VLADSLNSCRVRRLVTELVFRANWVQLSVVVCVCIRSHYRDHYCKGCVIGKDKPWLRSRRRRKEEMGDHGCTLMAAFSMPYQRVSCPDDAYVSLSQRFHNSEGLAVAQKKITSSKQETIPYPEGSSCSMPCMVSLGFVLACSLFPRNAGSETRAHAGCLVAHHGLWLWLPSLI